MIGDVLATYFRSKKRPAGTRVSVDPGHLVSRPMRHEGPKDTLPLISWATYRGDYRLLANVVAVPAIAFDVDDPLPSLDALAVPMVAALPIEWHLCTSFSSAPGALKFRAIGRLSRPMTSEEHYCVWGVLSTVLAAEGVEVDASCKDPSRAYYVPVIPPSGVYEHRSIPGDPLDVDGFLAAARELSEAEEAEREAEAATLAARGPRVPAGGATPFERARRYVAAVPGAVQGQNGSDATLGLAVRLVKGFALSDAETWELMATWNLTCAPPWSQKDLARKIREAREKGRMREGELLERRTA